MPNRVRVVVPASTANLGPGYDCLALALGLYNTFEFAVQSGGAGVEVDVQGEGADRLPVVSTNLAAQAAISVWDTVGRSAPPLKILARNGIPHGSGLGSSAAAVVGGLVGANALLGGVLDRFELLRRAYKLELSADNAAASLFGGLVLVSAESDALHMEQLRAHPFEVVIALPATQLSTAESRKVLPLAVPLRDALLNVGRTAFVIRALQRGDYALLEWAMQDRLHEPFRRALIYGFEDVARAARASGAAAVVLSGAGPGVAAFAPSGHKGIAAAMADAFAQNGMPCRTFILPVDSQGVQVSVVG